MGGSVITKYVVVGDLLISVGRGGTSSDDREFPEAEYQELLKTYQTAPITRYLAATIGRFGTSSTQRKQSAEVLKKRGIRCAVVTDDAIIRGVVTAVAWLGANTSAFSWADIPAALQYLGVTGDLATRALAEVEKLRAIVESKPLQAR